MNKNLPENISWFRLPEFVQNNRQDILGLTQDIDTLRTDVDDLISNPGGGIGTLQEVTTEGAETSVRSSFTNGLNVMSTSNPFSADLNVNRGNLGLTSNLFLFYNAVNIQPPSNTSALAYGISNLIEIDGSNNMGQLRGQFNRVRVDGAGTPSEINVQYNELSWRHTDSSISTNLMSVNDNYLLIPVGTGSGTIPNVVALRGVVRLQDTDTTIDNGFSVIAELDLDGGILNNFNVLEIDVDRNGGQWLAGAYIFIDEGYPESQGRANGIKVINSIVDLPSTFAGELRAKFTGSSPVTVADLSNFDAQAGDRASVSDADSPVYLSNVVGGGSEVVPVFYNGTNWIVA